MPLDADFQTAIEPLFEPGFGTENTGPLLYWLVRTTKPRNVLEVGLGYTTPFIAMALKDNADEFEADYARVRAQDESDHRTGLLSKEFHSRAYAPVHHAIDDLSTEGTTAGGALDICKDLGLGEYVKLHEGDFRGMSQKIDRADLPFDFVWFDCGGPPEYIDFLKEYWRLINPNHGHLLLHYTYWNLSGEHQGREVSNLICGPIANEIKRQQLAGGMASRFEVLSLVEPHKTSQGSVTMIRKLAPPSMPRGNDFQDEMLEIFGARPDPMPKLD